MNIEQRQRVIDLLLKCYTSKSGLEQLVYFRTGAHLDQIVKGGNLVEIVTDLVKWAEINTPALTQLIAGLTQDRSGRADV